VTQNISSIDVRAGMMQYRKRELLQPFDEALHQKARWLSGGANMVANRPGATVSTEVRFQPFGHITTEMVFPAVTQQIERDEAIEEAPRLTVQRTLVRESTYRILHS